ncbi:tRNA pseudouridine(38-40) synthase TruA [Methylotenera versatilis]|uniref:tRNA pseudouridine(38-40) synthase TruA n=1 Tax=Methylotenera versatilis TaxID=1055487 RepID=UPI000647F118|nr:tRNA pseudouridine(38-40) synthase TruA [Methylotenera versatilis]
MRIALGVEYDGAHFCGWQSQPEKCGVQDSIEEAIMNIANQPVRVHAAGRTDTGVHALMQVVHFESEVIRPLSAWVRGVNAFLPPSVRVIWAHVVDDDFHARFSATQRHYQYLLVNQPTASAIYAEKAGWYHLPLDISAMQAAIVYLQGEHDFSAFRASECQAKTPIRNLTTATVATHGESIVFNFSANAFLQHQVRNMVGALIYVGNGKYSPEWIKSLLAEKNRTLSPPTFSPNGLYLTGVVYHAKYNLPNTQRQLNFIR